MSWKAVVVVVRNPLGLASILLLAMVIMSAIFASLICKHDPFAIDLDKRLQAPSAGHIFGTDNLGRDTFARVIHGSRISLQTGLAVVLSAVVFGMFVGVIAGYFRGLLGEVLMRLTDAFMGFPYLVLALAIASVLGPSLMNALIAMILVWWPKYARLTRVEVLRVREQEFVEAARALGIPSWRMILFHILPNSFSPCLIQGSIDFGSVIIVAATLSFIGLGAQPPAPEWGAMMSRGITWLREAWWLTAFPGLAIFTTVMGFNLLGDAIRDALDPRMR